MKQAVVVGSGAGGATVAKELQGHFQVTVLEAGREFRPFARNLASLEKLKRTGLFFDEREIQLLFPTMRIRKTVGRMVLVTGMGLGGTTTICAGNAIRMDQDLRALGINMDAEFDELYREVPVTTNHQAHWREATRRLFCICQEMNLNPQPIPKMGRYERCVNCGQCVLGCHHGVKWDSRQFLDVAVNRGARVVTGCRVEKVVLEGGRSTGVQARQGRRLVFHPADLVVLAAGGLGTPVILQNSGIPCEARLFVDPVLCVAAEWPGSMQNREMTMPFVVQRNGYILSPYFDWLSFFFNRDYRYPAADTLGMMIKLADESVGSISPTKIEKALTGFDRARLSEAVDVCAEIFRRLGVRVGPEKEGLFLGTINAGHPGGMLPLSEREAATLRHPSLPPNLYVADATLLPRSLGNPPILTIMALAKRISQICTRDA
ncbi:MAG: GMC family oxidoreductase N-terminal domain-containing protein [Ignavibacteriales bacterium]